MRRLLCCLAVLCALGPAAALAASERPIHDCLEGGSMDMTTTDAQTPAPTPAPSTGS